MKEATALRKLLVYSESQLSTLERVYSLAKERNDHRTAADAAVEIRIHRSYLHQLEDAINRQENPERYANEKA